MYDPDDVSRLIVDQMLQGRCQDRQLMETEAVSLRAARPREAARLAQGRARLRGRPSRSGRQGAHQRMKDGDGLGWEGANMWYEMCLFP